MAFRHGDDNEALLTCRKCQGDYPLDAQFCGFCGAPRSVALGVERDAPAAGGALFASPNGKAPKFATPPSTFTPPPVPPKPTVAPTFQPAPAGGFVNPKGGKTKAVDAPPIPDFTQIQAGKPRGNKKSADLTTDFALTEIESEPKPKKNRKPLILAVVALVVVATVGIVIKINSGPKVTTAAAPSQGGPCAIADATVADVVTLKNSIDSIPTGSNQGDNKAIILKWAADANSIASTIANDESTSSGSIKANLYNISHDMKALSALATQWANQSYSNASTFTSDYSSASDKVRSDYKAMSTACGDVIPVP